MTHSLQAMRAFFESGVTRPYAFRKAQLSALKDSILSHEKELYDALYTDLKKSLEETWITETGMVIAELNTTIRNLRNWMRPERTSTNLLNLPSRSRIIKEPLGVSLIIGPWNYPFQLLIKPVIGAMAAGNCVVVKPSEFAPATSAVIKKIIEKTFKPDYILYVQGDGASVIPQMMNNFTFDHVFYTGSTLVGKIIYKMAAERLVPVTLELGGKSPCIIESDANIKVTSKRITQTKFSNAGQMCVAPDYILVHEKVKDEFIQAMKENIRNFYGEKPENSYDYGKIINEKQFDRISRYMSDGKKIYGGNMDRSKLYIEPTLLTDVPFDKPVMQEEIFGPVLPVIGFSTNEEVKEIVGRYPNPLSLYIYTSSREKENYWLENIAAGGACINNCSWHFTNHHLPFGGRGLSGMGQYHGRYSFDTFTHKKAVMKTPTWFDPAIKYPPLKGRLKLFKWVFK